MLCVKVPVPEGVRIWLGDNDELELAVEEAEDFCEPDPVPVLEAVAEALRVGIWLLERDAVWLVVIVKEAEYDWLGVDVLLPLDDCEGDLVSELLAEDDGDAC